MPVALAVLIVMNLALWIVVTRSSSSSSGAADDGGPRDVVTATPTDGSSRSATPTPTSSPSSEPSASPTRTPSKTPSGTPSETPSQTPTPSETPSGSDEPQVRLASTFVSASPHETVAVRGVVTDVPAGTTLRVEHRRGDRWLRFPLPTRRTRPAVSRRTSSWLRAGPTSCGCAIPRPGRRLRSSPSSSAERPTDELSRWSSGPARLSAGRARRRRPRCAGSGSPRCRTPRRR